MSTPEDQVSPNSSADKQETQNTLSNVDSHPGVDLKDALFSQGRMDILNDVVVTITIEIGRAKLKIRDLLNLTKGSVLELDKLAGDPVDVYANGKLISIGNIITANGKYCVRLMSTPDGKGAEFNDK